MISIGLLIYQAFAELLFPMATLLFVWGGPVRPMEIEYLRRPENDVSPEAP